jgi:hypothetical protein
MKKKVFSKLLMVALVATVGAFTSCKDYDDDINDLRNQINGLNTSLNTTVESKFTTVNNSINDLQAQLDEVEGDYAKADANLKTLLDEAQATGKVNASAIEDLRKEIVELKAAKDNLQEAINKLQSAQQSAKDLLESHGVSIVNLLNADKELTTGITEAKAQAANALTEAQKAQKTADDNAVALAGLDKSLVKAQTDIANNLTTVNSRIDSEVSKLNNQITTLSGTVATLSGKVEDNKADIITINSKLGELAKKDGEILEALDQAVIKLQDADKAAATNLTAAIDRISANETAIKFIQETLLPDFQKFLEDHIVPEAVSAEVEKQLDQELPKALKDYMKSDDIKALVATETGKNKTLIEALSDKVDEEDANIRKYIDTEFVLTVASMINESVETTAGEIKAAYEDADNKIKANISEIASELNNVKDQLNNEETGMAQQISELYSWFQPLADTGSSTGGSSISIGTGDGSASTGTTDGSTGTTDGSTGTTDGSTGTATGGSTGGGAAGPAVPLTKLEDFILKSEAFTAAMMSAVDEVNGEVFDMITSINLFANQHDAANDGFTWNGGFDHTLRFLYAIENETLFPNANDTILVNDTIKFVQDRFHAYPDSILVRVSPVTATLTPDMIALLNSQGRNIVADGLVEIEEVKPFDRLLTRSGETGLWVIKFNLKNDTILNQFMSAAYNEANRSIVYAVGAKRTAANKEEKDSLGNVISSSERYVVSEYDLDLGLAKARRNYDFTVNDLSVSLIHNRYIETEQGPQRHEVTDDPIDHPTTYAPELTWKSIYDQEVNDYTAFVYGDIAEKAEDRFNHTVGHSYNGIDNRHSMPVATVDFDDDGWARINIAFPDTTYHKLAGFYVLLDQDFADESGSSELVGWTKYIYENVGFYCTDQGEIDETMNDSVAGIVKGVKKATLFKGNEGTIKIKNARDLGKGDIIGFRVFAVNLDGTLYDPDGRAFYVKVGDTSDYIDDNTKTLTFELRPDNADADTTAAQAIDANFFSVDRETALRGGQYNFNWYFDADAIIRTSSNSDRYARYTKNGFADIEFDRLFKFQFSDSDSEDALKDNSNWFTVTNGNNSARLANAKYVRLILNRDQASRLLNNVKYEFLLNITLGDPEGVFKKISRISVDFTKLMPNKLPDAFGLKSGQNANLTFYLRPYQSNNSWNINSWFDASKADYGVSNISNSYAQARDVRPYHFEGRFEDLQDNPNYKFIFPECGFDGDDVECSYMTPYIPYTGLNMNLQRQTFYPQYVLPYVHYSVLGKKVAVKASYKYEGISFELENNRVVSGTTYWLPASYFKGDGTLTTNKDEAAFTAEFKNALNPDKFTVTEMQDKKVTAYNGNRVDTSIDGTDSKPVTYGQTFEVEFDSIKVSWKSDLAEYINSDSKKAEYFLTNFDFTQSNDDNLYKTDKLVWANDRGNNLYRKTQPRPGYAATYTRVDYVKIVDFKKPYISEVKLIKGATSSTVDYKNYFSVDESDDNFSLTINPTIDNPSSTTFDKLEVTVKIDAPTLVTQWGKTKVGKQSSHKIVVKNPVPSSRQTR